MSSLWLDSISDFNFCSLKEDLTADVCIIGGGITGISTAYYLTKAGLKVCVLEKDKLFHHATGNTTAKITAQHGLFYDYLINTFSRDLAKGYLDANLEAISNIKNIIDTEKIDCDFEFCDNYVFTDLEEEVLKIKHEVLAVNSLGFDAKLVDTISLPVKCLSAISFPNQAQFNPLKYGKGLVHCVQKNHGLVYENSKVYDVKKDGDCYQIYTKDNVVSSKYVVFACHYPIINAPGFYFLKMYQEASYLIAIETCSSFDGMYINTKAPIMSFRTALTNDKKRVVLIGGSTHKVGTKEDVSSCYTALEDLAKSVFPDAKVLYRFQTQDCISLDKLPYIGEFSSLWKNSFVATGFKKWGMTTSNVAATIISNSILGKETVYQDVFSSTRFHPIKNGTEFVNMLKQTTSSLVVDKFNVPKDSLNSIAKNSAKIIELDKTKIGIYRDENDKFYALKPICSHLGCELSWNDLEKTWDCPCHGSRFRFDGTSLYSPSVQNLKLLDLDL